MRASTLAALALLTLSAATGHAAHGAEPVRFIDRTRGWSVEIVPPWRPADRSRIEAIDAEAALRLPGRNFTFIAGFNVPDDDYPYVLVQHTPVDLSNASYDEIERSLGAVSTDELSVKLEEALGDLGRLVSAATPVLDRATNRIVSAFRFEIPGVGEVRSVSVGFLGARGPVQFNFYARLAEFDAGLPAFDALLSTFAFRPGEEYVPPRPKGRLRTQVRVAMIGGGVILLVAGALWLRLRQHTRGSGVPGA